MSSDTSSANALIVNTDENRALIQSDDKCDKYDYLIAVACGAVGGMIDIFLVGAPGDSVLGKWTDAQVDNAVKGFAKISGWSPKPDKTDSVASAKEHFFCYTIVNKKFLNVTILHKNGTIKNDYVCIGGWIKCSEGGS